MRRSQNVNIFRSAGLDMASTGPIWIENIGVGDVIGQESGESPTSLPDGWSAEAQQNRQYNKRCPPRLIVTGLPCYLLYDTIIGIEVIHEIIGRKTESNI